MKDMLPSSRHLYACLMIILILVLAWMSGVVGMYLCSPDPLPGDSLWAWREYFGNAFGTVLLQAAPTCLLGSTAGSSFLRLAINGLNFVAGVLAISLLWEIVVRPIRRLSFARRGPGGLLIGTLEDVQSIVRGENLATYDLAFVAPSKSSAWQIENAYPFAEVTCVNGSGDAGSIAAKLGASKATFVGAVSCRDMDNISVADRALDASPAADRRLLLRMEQRVVRSLRTADFLERADERSVKLVIISQSAVRVRLGVNCAMPGRYLVEGAKSYHAAICGSGPLLTQIAYRLGRQGYKIDVAPAKLSMLRTRSEPSAAAITRLKAATIAVAINEAEVDDDDAEGFDRAVAAIAASTPPLFSVHCAGPMPGEAMALARRWESVLLKLRLPIPPIVVYDEFIRDAGVSGMIRCVPLAELHDVAKLTATIDRRAVAAHETYLKETKSVRSGARAASPSEVEWRLLPERVKDDNRSAADHTEYKLASLRMRVTEGTSPAYEGFPSEVVKELSVLEHSRWMASKNIDGFKYGPARDDAAGLHPDMLPFEELGSDAKQKDVAQIQALPSLLMSAGQHIEYEASLIWPPTTAAERTAPLFEVAQCQIFDESGIASAERAIQDGSELELIIDATGRDILASSAPSAGRLAGLLRRAYRITHVT
ncbi:hypothetical protein GOB46_16055 [Sinorhizobium meliloti]|nr:hypothetical protein [Sinorhizobium meliloti]MDW9872282.1 hypothetical protein [Sinorhizobium meliloti]MDW9885410.1 hypothetical protein [Sinorhizobium meliloti]MDX0207307.1 hypothetical protein [Sinorhizobium meliloti]